MKSVPPSPRPLSRESLKAIPYEDTTAAEPPIPITVATPPSSPSHSSQNGFSGARGSTNNQRLSPQTARAKLQKDVRRDSGLAPSNSTARNSRTTLGTDVDSSSSIRYSPSFPSFSAPDESSVSNTAEHGSERNEQTQSAKEQNGLPTVPQAPFMGILTEIPTGSFEDLTIPGQVEFSKRGSMLIAGKKANNANEKAMGNGRVIGSRRQPNGAILGLQQTLPSRILSADDAVLSYKVRSLYEGGGGREPDWIAELHNNMGNGRIEEELSHSGSRTASRSREAPESHVSGAASLRVPSHTGTASSNRNSAVVREETELAGGIEDWEDLKGGDVDRYGFIVPRTPASQASSANSFRASSPDPPRLQRVSTVLQLASDTPRRQRSTIRNKRTSTRSPARSAQTPSSSRAPSAVVRPVSSQSSYRTINGKESRLRSATNRLPHNKDRRCVDEAGDMLTLPPGLADIVEDEEGNNVRDAQKKREWEREDKWRKMAKVVKNTQLGGGMVFEFDTKSPKLIDRTWKGIPDRWRATAWHAFLSASAKKRKGSATDDELITIFHKLLDQGSPDDVQIDIDVPRTINSHIMFRRRYRGGQRLLFRVLHCLSIYFPDTGYVQGMAALAATLLCYFDEEMTFVMLVRLWQLRGLERLYQSGFEGLMQALEEFERDWLGKGEVAAKLTDLNIPPTSYGTRWYLTLFNYSIPFPAQLRIWDVFMLLGDPSPSASHLLPPISHPSKSNPTNNNLANHSNSSNSTSFHGTLDILHAASAALIAGTREILLDSDFENAMKVLTSWIPVKDEEMMMRVARVEWKMRRRRAAL